MRMKKIILLTGIVTAIIAILVTGKVNAQTLNTTSSTIKNDERMNFEDVYPVFITKDIKSCKDFYVKWFDMKVLFEAEFFMLLTSSTEKYNIGFLSEVHPSSPPSAPAINSKAGVFLTLQVSDAKADFDRLKIAGIPIFYELRDEPWGQRRFGIVDPNGMYIDVVQQIEPAKGFWEKYPARN